MPVAASGQWNQCGGKQKWEMPLWAKKAVLEAMQHELCSAALACPLGMPAPQISSGRGAPVDGVVEKTLLDKYNCNEDPCFHNCFSDCQYRFWPFSIGSSTFSLFSLSFIPKKLNTDYSRVSRWQMCQLSKGWMALEVLCTLCRFRRPSNSTVQSFINLQGPVCGLVTVHTKSLRKSWDAEVTPNSPQSPTEIKSDFTLLMLPGL